MLKRLNPFAHLIERHVEEAAFLWVLRSVAVSQPQYGLSELKKLEMRIESHIDALVLSPDDAWLACERAQEFEEGGEAFVSALIAFRLMDVDLIRKATDFGLINEQTFSGICSALAWLPEKYSGAWLDRFLKSKDLRHKHLALAVMSLRRQDPGDYLVKLATREDCIANQPLFKTLLRIIGQLKRRDLIPVLNRATTHEDSEIKFWAIWSVVLLGNPAAAQHLKPFVFEDGPCQQAALDMAFRVLPVAIARQWISELSQQDNASRWVIQAAGVFGDSQVVPWLIEKMKDPVFARLAGESFVAITGIDLEHYKLVNKVPTLDELAQDDVDIDQFGMADENLPWPNSEKVAAVWQTNGKRFPPGQRFFWGKLAEPKLLKSLLIRGGQRQRSAAALTLALMQPESIYENVKAKVEGDLIGG